VLKSLWRRFGPEGANARKQKRVERALQVTTRENLNKNRTDLQGGPGPGPTVGTL
jgi:hypothetical protein